MSVLANRPGLRWIVPVSAAAAVLAGGAAIGAITAAADPSLPTRSASELLTDLQTARLDGLSGTVVQKANLGLPALPIGGAGSSDLASLISGTHTLRVWYSGPDQARVALVGTLGETDVITNGTDVWVWSSKDNTATHRTITAEDKNKDKAGSLPTPLPSMSLSSLTPAQLADAALKLLGPSTNVSTNGTATVAGRSAYELVLSPKDQASLVGSVRLAIDSTEHVPLRFQVFAKGVTEPAFEVAFTQISFTRPDASQFTFNPPPGAKVVEGTQRSDKPETKPDTGTGTKPQLAHVGSGWTTVIVAAMPQPDAKADNKGGDLQGLLKNLPAVHGSWGSGHLLTGNLFSVLVTDDGRILVGAVRPDKLYSAAADPAAKFAK